MYYLAGLLLIVAWVLYALRFHDPASQLLVYAGWVAWATGLILIILSVWTLRSKGRPPARRGFTQTTMLVETGIYAIVRHPLYLGWLLMYVAVIFPSQHWISVLIGLAGLACMVLICKQEDESLLERFGAAYEWYRDSVPALNLVDGIWRLWQRRRRV